MAFFFWPISRPVVAIDKQNYCACRNRVRWRPWNDAKCPSLSRRMTLSFFADGHKKQCKTSWTVVRVKIIECFFTASPIKNKKERMKRTFSTLADVSSQPISNWYIPMTTCLSLAQMASFSCPFFKNVWVENDSGYSALFYRLGIIYNRQRGLDWWGTTDAWSMICWITMCRCSVTVRIPSREKSKMVQEPKKHGVCSTNRRMMNGVV